MSRSYHLTPKGEPGLCKAVKQCPYGNENEHYNNKEDARKAYEKANESFTSKLDLIGLNAQEITNELMIDGNYHRPHALAANKWKFDAELGEYVKTEEKATDLKNYKFLNSGIERNVYIDKDKKYVYKIPNSHNNENSFYTKGDEINELAKIENEQKAYAALDAAKLSELGVEYAETLFYTTKDSNGHKIPVVVQQYLSEDEYEPHELPRKVQEELQVNFPLFDTHKGNVRKHKTTGRIVLFDCIDNSKIKTVYVSSDAK